MSDLKPFNDRASRYRVKATGRILLRYGGNTYGCINWGAEIPLTKGPKVTDTPFKGYDHSEIEPVEEDADTAKGDGMSTLRISPLKGKWLTRCAVCGKEYQNGCGSTPCCGALQEIISHDPTDELAALRAERDAALAGERGLCAQIVGYMKILGMADGDSEDVGEVIAALRDRAERAESDAAESKRNRLPLDETTRFILGRPNFVVCPIAHRLRELGHEIKRKCEDEQAYAIHWLLQLYLEHGSAWKDKANELLFLKAAALTPEASK